MAHPLFLPEAGAGVNTVLTFIFRAAYRLVTILKPSSNWTQMLFLVPRAVIRQSWPFRPSRFHQ